MRKKKHEEHANHERWLVSYADFITLLFAFFVVMFAVSQVDTKKVGRFTESFSKAVGLELMPESGTSLLPGDTNIPTAPASQGRGDGAILPEDLRGLKAALDALQATDAGTPDAGSETMRGVQVLVRRNELVIRLSDSVLFQSADDSVTDDTRKVVRSLAQELVARQVDVRVEGHTDDRPLRSKARFRSNWDLSTSRATAVLVELAAAGVPADRLSAAGYGEFHPVTPNSTDEGRRQNRRVDLVISQARKDVTP